MIVPSLNTCDSSSLQEPGPRGPRAPPSPPGVLGPRGRAAGPPGGAAEGAGGRPGRAGGEEGEQPGSHPWVPALPGGALPPAPQAGTLSPALCWSIIIVEL